MPFKSQAQRRYFYSQLPGLAKKWEAETPKRKLPEFVKGFKKTAYNMTDQAAAEAKMQFQDYVPGQGLREDTETGQAKSRVTRTPGVRNEDREFSPKIKTKYTTARS